LPTKKCLDIIRTSYESLTCCLWAKNLSIDGSLLAAGEGRRLCEGGSLRLKLVESKIFESGCVALRYLKQ
jgi:hypothetical protein